ncbi:(2Fe-2S)-binding protein [candidate division KSB1 bacterium]|nr:MAG: (2Fe-2S)-binding protein [candidate division KSB1 bacterium]
MRDKKSISRRSFIKGVGGGLAGTAALATGVLAKGKIKQEETATDSEKVKVKLNVNGVNYELFIEPRVTLVEALRDRLGLTGTKIICNNGECGGCTVIMDGRAVYSCMILAVDAQGTKIQTIEGIKKNGKLHPVQEAFIKNDAFQCGFCTPGFIMSAKALLDHNPHPDEKEIKRAVSGNICRCGSYNYIVKAVKEPSKIFNKNKLRKILWL